MGSYLNCADDQRKRISAYLARRVNGQMMKKRKLPTATWQRPMKKRPARPFQERWHRL